MLHLQTHKPCVSLDTARSAQTSNDSNVCSNLLKFLTISTVLIMTLAISSALAYPASSHTNSLPHRSVIYFAPKEDSVVKEFLNEVLINNCQLDERDVVIMVIAESGYTVPTWLEEEFNLDAVTRIYKIPKGSHTAVLIGKDGKEKYRWSGKTDWRKSPISLTKCQCANEKCSDKVVAAVFDS